MFDAQREVPSLELCKRLKELGYPQTGGGWYWVKTKTIGKETWRVGFQIKREDSYGRIRTDYQSEFSIPDIEVKEVVKAPTCRELGEWLPVSIQFENMECWGVTGSKGKREWYCGYIYPDEGRFVLEATFFDDTEPNARAKMLIWLVKNGYLCFEKKDKEETK